MHLANYLGYLHRAELNLAEGFREVGEAHAAEADIYHTCNTLARQCEAHAGQLEPFVSRYGEETIIVLQRGPVDDPSAPWTVIGQAAQGARDKELLAAVQACEGETATQIKWLKTRMKQAAPQALLVAS